MQWLAADTQASRAKAMSSINGGAASESYGKVLEVTDALDKSVNARAAQLRADAADVRSTSLKVLGGTLLLAVILAFFMGTWVTRSVVSEPTAHLTVRLCPAITAFRIGYYENSVTVGLATFRQSHVPLRRNVLARRRCPIHALQCLR